LIVRVEIRNADASFSITAYCRNGVVCNTINSAAAAMAVGLSSVNQTTLVNVLKKIIETKNDVKDNDNPRLSKMRMYFRPVVSHSLLAVLTKRRA
jgi:hypothetical protein